MRKDIKNKTEPTRRRHVWKSFTSRIEQVQIDVARTIKRVETSEEETESYFRSGLDKWSELNLTIPFTEFLQSVDKKAKSLAQIVHHQKDILDALIRAISVGDPLALDALLDLLVQLVRDLQSDFEPYLSVTIETLIPLTKNPSVEVIEAVFTTFAYLFKYLYRPIAANPIPTFDAFAVLLARDSPQKPYIVRFAAESMSFLFRRTNSTTQKDLLQHLRNDAIIHNSQDYQEGLSYLIAETIKGVDHSIHAKGLLVFKNFLDIVKDTAHFQTTDFTILSNVTINLLHHCLRETYVPCLDAYISLMSSAENSHKELGWRMCFLSCAVRKGTRIQDWTTLAKKFEQSLQGLYKEDLWDANRLASVLFTYAPHEALLPVVQPILNQIRSNKLNNFLILANIVAKQNRENFINFILPFFRTTVNNEWSPTTRLSIVRSVIDLKKSDALPWSSSSTIDGRLKISEKVATNIISLLDDCEPELNNQALITSVVYFARLVQGSSSFGECMSDLFQRCIRARSLRPGTRYLAVLIGEVFETLTNSEVVEESTFLPVLAKHPGLWTSAKFLQGYADYVSRRQTISASDFGSLIELLSKNLSRPGHTRRLHSLRILQKFDIIESEVDSDLLSVCEIIEKTDLTLDATRALAMQIRKIEHNYVLLSNDVLKKAMARFCMGLMTGNYTPFWSFCSDTLAFIARSEPDMIWSMAKDWFLRPETDAEDPEEVQKPVCEDLTVVEAKRDSFRCFNTTELQENSIQIRAAVSDATNATLASYMSATIMQDESTTVSRRAQAIRIFSSITEVAEQHCQDLVPVFLEQFSSDALDEEEQEEQEEQEEEGEETALLEGESVDTDHFHKLETEQTTLCVDSIGSNRSPHEPLFTARMNKKERNDLLVLFSKFLNPAAFPNTDKFKTVVMDLLASRDSRTQALALEILLHYRDHNLKQYEDNLKNLLSDTRSRDEITTFLQTDASESPIEDRHRPYVMPVIARILYGRMINRRHASSQKKGLANSRNIILGAVASMPAEDIRQFIEVFLRSFASIEAFDMSTKPYRIRKTLDLSRLTARKMIGFCTMMQDAMIQLAGKILPFVPEILNALIYCFLNATKILQETMDTDENSVTRKVARSIRHSIYQTMDLLFQYCRQFEWSPYLPIVFECFINPRIDNLPQESSQNPSGVLKLISNWSSSSTTAPLLVEYNDAVLLKVFECLSEKSVKDSVAIFVLQIVQNLCTHVKDPTTSLSDVIRNSLLKDKIGQLFGCMSVLLQHQQTNITGNTIRSDFLDLEISVLCSVSDLVSGGPVVQALLNLLTPMLTKPRKLVPENVKEGILTIINNFLPYSQDYLESTDLLWERYHVICTLFSSCSSRTARTILSSLMEKFGEKDKTLVVVAAMVKDLNAFSTKRLDTPDFDRRLVAFAQLNEKQYNLLSVHAWRPLIYNMIFFIGDEEELAIRTNASYTLRRFIEVTSQFHNQESFLPVLELDLYPAIRKGMRHSSELIRQEWVGVLGYIVKKCSFWDAVRDMTPLLVDGDEEANFFYNIMHIQQHRRLRALRRLVSISKVHEVQSNTIAHILLPLIEHYCFAPKEDTHNLVAETITTIGQLAQALRFNQYSALLKRYIGLLKTNAFAQLTAARLVGAVVDALVGKPEIATELVDYMQDQEESEDLTNTPIDVNPVKSASGSDETPLLLRSRPSLDKFQEVISANFLPPLINYLHMKDDETVALRIPIALTVVKLLAALPQEGLTQKLPGVLTDVCHILRSRSQEARDMTRKILGQISTLLGPKFFSYILVELKNSLQRGYQLHVLGFSVHTILVKLLPEYGTIDYCLEQLVNMLIDDIFGETGLEKDAEDYITRMKEMKSTKSYDSFEILASNTKLENLGELLWPLKPLLVETSNSKVIRKIDEVCRRVTLGILRNQDCNTRNSLLFCYNIYNQTMSSTQGKTVRVPSIQEQARMDAERNYVVDLKARKAYVRDNFRANAHKLVKFSLETMRAILSKYSDLQTAEYLAAFVPIIGDSLMSGHEDVQLSALRLLTQIIKVNMKSLDTGAPVFLEQAIGFIKASPSTKTELCQASLKFVSAILKERQEVTVKDNVLAYLLIRIKTDLEEPDRQGVTFSILRSIMSRKFMVPELYEIMDEVGSMMITNQSAGPRNTARSAYYQFLLDYPQGKGRLKKQLLFLVKNLGYVHASGRISVMEVLNLISNHFDDSILQEYIMMLYFALTMSLVNDDDPSCREMSAAIIKKLISRADETRMSLIVSALRSWAYSEEVLLQRASLQGFGLLFEIKAECAEEMQFFVEKCSKVLVQANNRDCKEEEEAEEDRQAGENLAMWQTTYYALQTFTKLLNLEPQTYIASRYASLWYNVRELLRYKHSWIRLSTSRLIGILFSNRQVSASKDLIIGKNLTLQDIDLVKIGRHSLIQLRSPLLSHELGTQIVKNLIFLLKFFNEKNTILPPHEDLDGESEAISQSNSSCVAWLLQRVATLLQSDRDINKETHLLVRKLLLQFFAAAIKSLSDTKINEQSIIIARPLYKYAEMQTHTSDQEVIKDLAVSVFDLLKDKIGQTKFAEVYNSVRQAQVALRQDRRQKRTIENVKFPERGAQKKAKAGLKKRDKRAAVAKQYKHRREMH